MSYNVDYKSDLETKTELENNKKRPVSLTVLCILTFIGSGFSAISNLSWAMFYDTFLEIVLSNDSEIMQQMADTIMATNKMMFLVDFLLYAGSLAGAILMLNLKKLGFHIYTVANILLALSPAFLVEGQGINFLGLGFITIPFIALYALHLKHMK
jgi:hypothetical protein